MPRRVLMTTDAVGGVWHYSLDLAAAFEARGIEVLLALVGPAPSAPSPRLGGEGWDEETSAMLPAPNPLPQAGERERRRPSHAKCADPGRPARRFIDSGVALDWTAETQADLASGAARLAAIAADFGADTAHLHAPAFASGGAWRCPIVAVAHSCVATWWRRVRGGTLPNDFAWRTAAAAEGLRAADAVLAPTRAHADDLAAVYGIKDVCVAHNGRRPLSPGRAGRGSAILTAGRLWDEGKNVRLLDGIAAELTVPILAAGPTQGPNGASIQLGAMRQLGILNSDAMAEAFAGASIFAAPALYEPFGLTVLEAAHASLPLVLSDIPSFRELWDGAALFVPPTQPAAWQDALQALAADPAACADLGAKAAQRAQRYTVAAMTEAVLAAHRRTEALARTG